MEKYENIAFDADGVLFDTEEFQLKYAIDYFKEKYNMELVNENGYGIKEMFDCSDEQEKDFWTKHAIKYSLFYKAREGAAETISKLRSEGRKVHIITSKAWALEKGIGALVRFLFETGLKRNGIEVDAIHYCSVENSAKDKVDKCREYNIDVMVEDKKENVTEINEETNVLCMNTRNNKNYELGNIKRVYNFDEVYTGIIKIIDKEKKSIYSTFTKISKEDKQQLSPSELKEYYIKLREYYSNLPFDKRKLNKGETNFKIISNTIGSAFKAKYNPQIINEELIPNEKGKIFVSNHLCDKDMLLILSTLKGVKWHPLIKKEILDDKAGILFKLVNSIFVDRKDKQSRKESLTQIAKMLMNNGDVLIFPEGTYNRTDNNLIPFAGSGVVYLSQSLDKHIVPMAITKNYNKGESPIVRVSEPIKIGIKENLDEANIRLWNIMNDLVEKNKQLIKKINI